MALIQAGMVRDRLAAAHRDLAAPGALEIVVIRTTGDRVQDRPLYEIGGKALFTKEIEEAFARRRHRPCRAFDEGRCNLAAAGLAIACLLPRDDPRDAFLSHRAATLRGTATRRGARYRLAARAAQVLHLRPDLRIVSIRGNAGTRIRKLAAGECDATLLSLAGLRRIKEEGAIASIVSTEDMLPAATQGAIGIECRADDRRRANVWCRCTTPRQRPASKPSARSSRRSAARAARRSPLWRNSRTACSRSAAW